MTEQADIYTEVFTLHKETDIKPAADAVMDGKITVMKVGSVFSILYNPNIADLTEKICLLKGRQEGQVMSVVCSYGQAKQIVNRELVNKDFFLLSDDFCSKVIIRIPIDKTITLSFPYNAQDDTLQFLNFGDMHPIRKAFREELASRGCEYISITSGNIHDAPTIEELEPAKMLAALFNIKASFWEMHNAQTVVTDIPTDRGAHKGSFIILSFCNPDAIEVKRLANKVDREVTEKYLDDLFAELHTQTPLVYAL